MTKIKPFRAIRPTRDKAYLIATRPFYVYKENVLKAKLEHNPYTFLHVINPEFHTEDKTRPNSPERFQKIRNKFDEFIRQGYLFQDQKDSLYLYRQTTPDHVFNGLIGGAAIDEYENNQIKKHEDTLTSREEMFSQYLQIVEFHVEPVLLFHEKHDRLSKLLALIGMDRPEYEFSSTNRIKHEIWVINDRDTLDKIQSYYEEIDSVYIADGHHRCASSARYRASLDDKTSTNQDHFLAYYISEDNLQILDYNRLIKDLNGLSDTELLSKLNTDFIVTKVTEMESTPLGLHEISMYLSKSWYKLTAKEGTFDRNHPVYRLDTDILTKNILAPIFDIVDLKTDQRITFIHGGHGMEGLKNAVDKGDAAVGFGLFPVSVDHLKKVSDEQLIMPPKSTWIEPKLRSGLTIFPLDD